MKEKNFNIIESYVKEEIKISNSIFIAHLEPAKNIEDVKFIISDISDLYNDATHNCWAYIVGNNGNFSHSSDDGEPSGTAGKPILNTLLKYNLTNVVAIVTRYYGGTKLGVRGLIDAYSGVTEKAILNTELKKLIEKENYKLILDYDFFDIFKHKLKSFNGEILNTEYTEKIKIEISIEKEFDSLFKDYVKEKTLILV
ncbi:MAG: YigZ family protein [Candidatus Sericytochromatia bacterium]